MQPLPQTITQTLHLGILSTTRRAQAWSGSSSTPAKDNYVTRALAQHDQFVDPEMEDGWKKKIARNLHSFKRQAIKTGKPTFPVLLLGATKSREAMQEQVGPESCLIWDLLKLKGPKDWLLVLTSTR